MYICPMLKMRCSMGMVFNAECDDLAVRFFLNQINISKSSTNITSSVASLYES
jgi:hypothetical protein